MTKDFTVFHKYVNTIGLNRIVISRKKDYFVKNIYLFRAGVPISNRFTTPSGPTPTSHYPGNGGKPKNTTISKTHRLTSTIANTSINRGRGGVVIIWNDSSTIELTVTIPEIRKLCKRFFIDIEDVVSDELMGQLLHHFRDQGILLDEEGIRI